MMRIRDLFRKTGPDAPTDVAARFSVLRTRLLQEMGRQGAQRLGVCSISDGAGATYVAANLALAAARLPNYKVLLVDLALGQPSMAMQLGMQGDPNFLTYLRKGGTTKRLGTKLESQGSLTCIMPDGPVEAGAELLQDVGTRDRIATMVSDAECDIAIFDLSPVLGTDEGLAALPMMDAILLVADGRAGTGQQVADCQRLMADMPPLLGVVLNKAELLG